MKTYIFMSNDGYTEDNTGNASFNAQVLYTTKADNLKEAIAKYEAEKRPFDRVRVDKDVYAGDSEDGMDYPYNSYIVSEIADETTWEYVYPPSEEKIYCNYCRVTFFLPHHCFEHGQEECPVCHSIDIEIISKEKE